MVQDRGNGSDFLGGTRRKIVVQNHGKEWNYPTKYFEQPIRQAFTTLSHGGQKRKT